MRSLIILSIALLTFTSQTARAEFQINDPKGLFVQFKQRFGTTLPFVQALPCGTQSSFTSTFSRCEYRCTTSFCTSRCEDARGADAKFALHADECTADSLSIFGDNGISVVVARSEFEDDGTWLRSLLRSMGHFIQPEGEWTFRDLRSGSASVLIGGKIEPLTKVMHLEFELSFGPVGTQTERYFILLNVEKTGIDQLLAFGQGLFPDPKADMFFLGRGVVIKGLGGGLFP